MEKVYWISGNKSLDHANKELEKYGGHVTMISTAPTTEDQEDCVHAFIVVSYPRDTLPKK